MRIQTQIFLTILVIFSGVFGLATWLYSLHFNQTLNQAESRQAEQINQYVQRQINTTLASNDTVMAQLNADGDVISAYDQVDWLAFMGKKFVIKTVTDLFKSHPHLQHVTFLKDNEDYIVIPSPKAGRHPASWINQTMSLDVKAGKLSVKTDILTVLQKHLQSNNINPSTRLYFTNPQGAWVVSRKSIDRLPLELTFNDDDTTHISNAPYLASAALGQGDWSVRSLISRAPTHDALEELYIKATLTYLFTAFLFFLIARSLSHLMIKPLHKLETAALSIMAGEYSTINAERQDELLPAIQAFNLMSTRIQGFTKELQDQVAARTKELQIANAELALMNETDVLTRARSRQFLSHHVNDLIKLAHRSKLSLGLAMFDIDHFKNINDSFGHMVGDQCLIAFVEKMHSVFRRDNDWVVRYGGEEFCLICFGLDPDGFKKQLELFRSEIEEMTVLADTGAPVGFTTSIGFIHYQQAPERWNDTLLASADDWLYKAKRQGRNRILGTIEN